MHHPILMVQLNGRHVNISDNGCKVIIYISQHQVYYKNVILNQS